MLKEDDDYEDLKDFADAYEGTTSASEKMHLAFQKLLQDFPDLARKLDAMPGRVFSGKKHPAPESKAVFFCFAMPAPTARLEESQREDAAAWTEEAGFVKWYLYEMATEKILEDPLQIDVLIASKPETLRQHLIPETTLTEMRIKMEKHIKNTYLKQVQAPIGVKPNLKCWMELS